MRGSHKVSGFEFHLHPPDVYDPTLIEGEEPPAIQGPFQLDHNALAIRNNTTGQGERSQTHWLGERSRTHWLGDSHAIILC